MSTLSVRYITRFIQDQTLLVAGIGIGLLGSILQIDIPKIEKTLPVKRFISGFILSYFAFTVKRIVVMGIFSNILGPSRRGTWMGVIMAAGMMARSLAPFIAWQAMEAVNWKTWLNFGLCSLVLLSALVGTIINIDFLVPYDEFVRMHTVYEYESFDADHGNSPLQNYRDCDHATKSAVAIDEEKRLPMTT